MGQDEGWWPSPPGQGTKQSLKITAAGPREKVSLGVLKVPREAIDHDRSKWEVLVIPSSSEPRNSLKQEDFFL